MKKKLLKMLGISFFLLAFFPGSALAETNISSRQIDATHFTITVSGLPGNTQSVQAPTWSATNGQDDLKWYNMTKNGDGTYTHTVNISDHNRDDGVYYVHIYVTDGNGNNAYSGQTYQIVFVDRNQWNRFEWDGSGYIEKVYHASLDSSIAIVPNVEANNLDGKIRSGYGFGLETKTTVKTNEGADASKTLTGIQNMNVTFPEFNYELGVKINGTDRQFNRLGEVVSYQINPTSVDSTMNFKKNEFSTNQSRVHFTPLWFPDTKYGPYVEIFDAWTPGGMLATVVKPNTDINGQIYDDWHIAPTQ